MRPSDLASGLERRKREYVSGAARRRDNGADTRAEPAKLAKKLTESVRVDFSGRRWIVARAMPGQEARVCADLAALGHATYLPMGRKVVHRRPLASGGPRRRDVVEFPVFAPYLFVGVAAGREVDKHSSDRIASIVGDFSGQWHVPAAALERINALELDGAWDSSRSWAEKSRFQQGDKIRVIGGAFAGFEGVVLGLGRSLRVELHQSLFGASVRASLDACQLEGV